MMLRSEDRALLARIDATPEAGDVVWLLRSARAACTTRAPKWSAPKWSGSASTRSTAASSRASTTMSVHRSCERRYVIGVVYREAKDGRPYLLLRENAISFGHGFWFEVVGRVGPQHVALVERGTWASRVEWWRERHPW